MLIIMAKFNFRNLSKEVREKSLTELMLDENEQRVYLSGRLNEEGRSIYIKSLRNAISDGDEEDLEKSIQGHLNITEIVNGVSKKVPSNAAQLLAQGEFNRYYIRGLCLWALERGIQSLEIYRARESSWSRPESEAKIGSKLDAADLLDDLRRNIGKQPEYLPEVNSGLSVFL